MRENISMFKNWYRLAKPSKKYWFLAFLTVFIAGLCSIIEPYFASNVITNINNGKYIYTAIFLIIGFIFILVRKGSWDLNYRIYHKLIGHSYLHIENLIFDKISKANSKSLKSVSKEKLLNIFHSDAFTVSDLSDKLATRIGRMTRLLITIGAIFAINIPVALVIILIDILNYFILNNLNNKVAFYSKKISETNDVRYLKFSEIFDSKDLIKDLDITDKIKKDFINSSKDYLNFKNKQTIVNSYIDNYFHVFYQFIILLVTLFMVFMVSRGQVSLTLYFMIISYLTSGIEVANDFMLILPELKKANVATNRINSILEIDEEEMLEFGNNKMDDILGSIDFKKVCYKANSSDLNSIKNINFSINQNEIALFLGAKNCGKRTIFNILRREVHQDSGNVYIDGINLWDYTKKTHSSNLNYVTTKPYFFSGSIMKNLRMVEYDKRKIYEMCKKIGIYDYIISLPHKFNTDVNSLPMDKKYIISLARTLLTKSEIIILYEFPIFLSEKEEQSIKNILLNLKSEKTIIIFSASDKLSTISDKIYKIERGTIIESIVK